MREYVLSPDNFVASSKSFSSNTRFVRFMRIAYHNGARTLPRCEEKDLLSRLASPGVDPSSLRSSG